MEKLIFDTGKRRYQINDGSAMLVFNPTDPNVYARIMEATEKIAIMERECMERAKAEEAAGKKEIGEIVIEVLKDADKRAKKLLSEAFGSGNDFDKIFDGVNIVAKRKDGGRVIDAFLEAIFPIIEQGVSDLIKADEAAVEKYTADYA